jgi:hypothetical protein
MTMKAKLLGTEFEVEVVKIGISLAYVVNWVDGPRLYFKFLPVRGGKVTCDCATFSQQGCCHSTQTVLAAIEQTIRENALVACQIADPLCLGGGWFAEPALPGELADLQAASEGITAAQYLCRAGADTVAQSVLKLESRYQFLMRPEFHGN